MPDAFAITTLNACEKRMAARMLGRVGGCGYLLGDAHYDYREREETPKSHASGIVSP